MQYTKKIVDKGYKTNLKQCVVFPLFLIVSHFFFVRFRFASTRKIFLYDCHDG